MSIKKYDKDDNYYYHNAHRIYLFNESDIIKDIKSFEYIRISAFVTCPYYGTSSIISNDYKVNETLLESSYSFNTGNGVDAHK